MSDYRNKYSGKDSQANKEFNAIAQALKRLTGGTTIITRSGTTSTAPSTSSLTVKEADDSPKVSNVNQISFDNEDFAVTQESSSSVLINTSGLTIVVAVNGYDWTFRRGLLVSITPSSGYGDIYGGDYGKHL